MHNSNSTVFDIIGDVHGHMAKLDSLLQQLGYQHNGEHYYQDGHCAVFVGDLIDKGPQPAAVLQQVRAMVDSGNALMVIGNHEINWINDAADYTADAQAFIRATHKHRDRLRISNAYQHDPAALVDMFAWLRRQPLYIDLPQLRVVHACWNEEAIELLQAAGIECMDDNALDAYRERYSDLYLAIDLVVAGCMHQFPADVPDNAEFTSLRSRIRWFPLGNIYVNAVELQPLPVKHPPYPAEAAPLFFGHYALDGSPDILASNLSGVDFSAAYGRALTAYRLRPGEPLHKRNFFRSRC